MSGTMQIQGKQIPKRMSVIIIQELEGCLSNSVTYITLSLVAGSIAPTPSNGRGVVVD